MIALGLEWCPPAYLVLVVFLFRGEDFVIFVNIYLHSKLLYETCSFVQFLDLSKQISFDLEIGKHMLRDRDKKKKHSLDFEIEQILLTMASVSYKSLE